MDYAKVIERFKNVFKENGAVEESDCPYFAPADNNSNNYRR